MEQSSINGPFSMAMLVITRGHPVCRFLHGKTRPLETFSHLSAGCADDGLHSHASPPHLTQEVAGWIRDIPPAELLTIHRMT